MKAILKYPGSKWRIADEIVKRIPEHHSYLEPFFGSGAVFFNKEPSDIETINDLDNEIPNLFKCIRDDPEKLAARVTLTPYSRYEYENAYGGGVPADEYDQAMQFLIRCWQGYGYRVNGKVGWKNDVQGRESMYALRSWYNLPDNILKVAERLRCVQIENQPALKLIRRFNHPNVFMYVDPPYLMDTRLCSRKQYKHEMTQEDHIELLEELAQSQAKVIISGYESELYDEILKGWNKAEFRSNNQHGQRVSEIIWMNFEYAEDEAERSNDGI